MSGSLKYKLKTANKIKNNGDTASIIPLAQTDMVSTFIMGVHPWFEDILKRNIKDFDKISQAIFNEMRERFTNPILNIVASLPKDELADMAETLVSITSFMRRVSSDLETVGGPIDVAVISKKDGFIWIKRKHYFQPEKNHHFFNRETSMTVHKSIKQEAQNDTK